MQCQGFVTKCRQCGKKYKHGSTINPCTECGADRRCHDDAVKGWRWCDSHGGPNPSRGYYGRGRGILTGAGSSFPLERLAAKYNETRKNGSILSNRAVLEVLQERLVQLLDRIDKSDFTDRLLNLQEAWNKYRSLSAAGMHVEAAMEARNIDGIFQDVYHDYMAWEQALKVIDLHRKTVETEVKIFEKIHGVLTAERAYELVAQLAAIVMRTFPEDPKRLKIIQYEFARLIGESQDGAIDVKAEDAG